MGGGLQNGRGEGQVNALPLQKEGAEQVLAMLKGMGVHKTFEVVFIRELESLAIPMGGGGKKFPPVKIEGGGGTKGFTPS